MSAGRKGTGSNGGTSLGISESDGSTIGAGRWDTGSNCRPSPSLSGSEGNSALGRGRGVLPSLPYSVPLDN